MACSHTLELLEEYSFSWVYTLHFTLFLAFKAQSFYMKEQTLSCSLHRNNVDRKFGDLQKFVV